MRKLWNSQWQHVIQHGFRVNDSFVAMCGYCIFASTGTEPLKSHAINMVHSRKETLAKPPSACKLERTTRSHALHRELFACVGADIQETLNRRFSPLIRNSICRAKVTHFREALAGHLGMKFIVPKGSVMQCSC
jgi:hypothetical protein